MDTSIFDRLKDGIRVPTPDAMEKLGGLCARLVPPDSLIGLSGDLGVGKTTFCRGFARALGITQPVTSPSYNLYNIYSSATRQFVHLDAYRLDRDEDIDALMLEEFLRSPWNLLVEWPERVQDWIRQFPLVALEFEINDDESRQVRATVVAL